MRQYMRDENGLPHIVDQCNDPKLVSAYVKDGGGSAGFGIPRHVRLAKERLGVLEVHPSRLSGKFEPAIKCAGVLAAFAGGIVERSKFLSADHVHNFT